MKSQKMMAFASLAIVPLIVFNLQNGSGRSAESGTGSEIRNAIAKSLPYLERDGQAWMEGRISFQESRACVSCHQVPFAIWSQNAAAETDITLRPQSFNALKHQAVQFLEGHHKARVMSVVPLMLSGSISGEQDSVKWQEYTSFVVSKQQTEGFWKARGQFPSQNRPARESDDVATLWTILALSLNERPAEAVKKSRDRALNYIRQAEDGISNEWLLTRMLVEQTFDDRQAAESLREELLRQQKSDGGWGWLPEDESNAYSTGQTLYALRLSGLPPTHDSIRSGAAYLLETQKADGTWYVDSDLTSSSGSEAKSYVYTYWGTAWAVIGLSQICDSPAYSAANLIRNP